MHSGDTTWCNKFQFNVDKGNKSWNFMISFCKISACLILELSQLFKTGNTIVVY